MAQGGRTARGPVPAPRGPGTGHRAGAHHPRSEGPRVGPRRRAAPRGGRTARQAGRGRLSGLARVRSAAVGLPRGCRRAARVRLGVGGQPQGARRRAEALPGGRARARARGGAPARLRRGHARPPRAAALGLVLGHPGEPAPTEPVPARPRSRGGAHRRPGGDHRRAQPDGSEPRARAVAIRSARAAPGGGRGSGRRRAVAPSLVPPGRGRANSNCCSRSGAGSGRSDWSRCRPAFRHPGSRTSSATQRPSPRRCAGPCRERAVPGDAARHALPLRGSRSGTTGRRRARRAPDRDGRRRPRARRGPRGSQGHLRALAVGVAPAGGGRARDPPAVRRPDRHLQDRRRVRAGRPLRDRRLEDRQGAERREDLEERQLQLALYRLAYARWKGIEPERIDAVFYFVADDAIIRPERLFGEAELLERWEAAFTPS